MSENIKVVTEEGKFGYFARICRGITWICISGNAYKILNSNIAKLKKANFDWILKLSQQKQIAVFPSRKKTDALIHNTHVTNGKTYDTFIILGE